MINEPPSLEKSSRLVAIILAAGLSSRMVEFKPLLKFGAKTVLEHVVDIFRGAGVRDILVVVGHRSEDLIPTLQSMHIRWVNNPKYEEGMLSSIKTGISAIGNEFDAFFVMPVDIPLVETRTISRIIDAFKKSEKLIFYPVFRDKRGHPPLISIRYRDEILSWDQPGGLKSFLSQNEDAALNIGVQDEHILMDMDTQVDYKGLLKIYKEHERRNMGLGNFSTAIDQRYFEDYVPGSVHEFGSITVDQNEIISFAKRFDPQTFHTDPEAAKKSIYGGLIASGWHSASLLMRLFVDHYLSHVASLGSPGVEELRWLKPVRPGDTLSLRITVSKTKRSRSKPDRGIVYSYCEAINQNGDVVMTMKALNLISCRNSA
ncbi:MAG: NTP transferase domain-containing protein [Desulfomonilaceae bacterium]